MTDRIRALFVEDDPDWQNGIQDFLSGQEDIELYACVSTVEECFAHLNDQPTDIVIMDIILNEYDASGLDAALDISLHFPDIKVIMLSSLDSDDEVFNEAFLNGAYEYIYKYDFEQLPDTMRGAMRNPTSKYGERLRKLVYEKKKGLLSIGDSELLKLILEGKTQTEIAKEFHVSVAAVKKHVGRVLKKFQWQESSRDLALKCKKWGILD